MREINIRVVDFTENYGFRVWYHAVSGGLVLPNTDTDHLSNTHAYVGRFKRGQYVITLWVHGNVASEFGGVQHGKEICKEYVQYVTSWGKSE